MQISRPAIAACALASALALATGANAAPCQLADLRWMAGVWRAGDAQSQSEERWVVGPGDRLMGSSWELNLDRPGGVVEAETIQSIDGAVRLRLRHFTAALDQAWEDKTAPMTFAAATCARDAVIFDGEDAHAGEHITYHRAGGVLTFTGDFLHQGKPVQVVIKFKRQDDLAGRPRRPPAPPVMG